MSARARGALGLGEESAACERAGGRVGAWLGTRAQMPPPALRRNPVHSLHSGKAGSRGVSATTGDRARAVRRARGVRGGGGRPAPRGRCRVGAVGDAVRPARLAGQLLNGGEVADATFRRQARPADGATRAHTLASLPCMSRRAVRLNSPTSAPMPHPRPSPPAAATGPDSWPEPRL